MARANDDTIDVRASESVDSHALRAWLASVMPEIIPAGSTLEVRQFPAGFSNLTYRVSVHTDDGVRAYVLRRPPRGVQPGRAHDVGREHDLLAALHPEGVPVPRAIVRCDDASVIGAPFYLMEHVDGVILRGASSAQLRQQGDNIAEVMGALSRTFVSTLSQLHAVDVSRGVLSSLGRPQGYVQRQVDGWTQRWHAARTSPLPDMEQAAAWLAAHRPPERGAALIHNDFKFDNLVLDRSTTTRVVAILDWEMATIGDPLMDLGTSLAYWVEAADAPVLSTLGLGITALPGSLSRAGLVQAYGVASGRDVSDAVFYYVFGLFKVAVIAQQIFARHQKGLTADPRFAALGPIVAALAGAATNAAATETL